MTLQEFRSTCEKLGEGASVVTKIDGTEITDAKIHKEDGDWYICQNERSGVSCVNKLGYEYSWVVRQEDEAQGISYLSPAKPSKPTLETLKVGDFVENRSDKHKVLAVSGLLYWLSEGDNFDRYLGGYTLSELKEYGYKPVQPEVEEETIEIEGKKYTVKEIKKALKVK